MSTPRINPNDPKWTAYVLGELDEADRAAVERLLAQSPEARALVDEMSSATAVLSEALASEPALHLTAAQRAAVRREADTQALGLFARPWLRWGVSLGAAAIAILLGVALQPSPAPPQVALQDVEIPPPPVAPPAPIANTPPVATPPVESPPRAEPAPDAAVADARKTAETITVAGETPVVDVQSARSERAQGSGLGAGVGRGGAGGRAAGVSGGIPGGVVGGVVGGLPEPPAAPSQIFAAPPPPIARAAAPSDVSIPRLPTGAESYARVGENAFVRVSQEPLATFSIDVDTASYANVRRFLTQRQLPPADAVRIEELVNYFSYGYARPTGPHPIGASMHVTEAPWNPRHRLVRIGVKAREIGAARPASNLVFLIDVSGSMNTPQKLPLVKSGLKMLVDQLGENDTVSIVVYAGASGLVLPPTSGERKDVIARAIEDLQAGGSTNGGAGIQLAYRQATANFIRGGVNRVILVTDGDFNVGITNPSDLTRLIEDSAKSGVFLSVLGFGMGNLKDSTLERLADMGNGHYAYIDTLGEARKVLVEEIGSTLVTVAKDVKIQVDFNPGRVEAYRLIGYENRALRPEDFNNDLKDAGDMGAGHTVTALFEIVPRGGTVPGPSIDPSVFQPAPPRDAPPPASTSNDMLVLRIRYKQPEAAESTRLDLPLADRGARFTDADADFRFAASVAAFGMILKGSAFSGTATLGWVLDTATASQGQDRSGYRREFLSLVQMASTIRDGR